MTNTADYRLTEERLRNHLNGNQPARELMCLALLPLLGSYTREHPRRPQGGRDGSRDIEALYQGNLLVWGAVGFRNGGGSDSQARNDAINKFNADLASAKQENPSLAGFVFFTNVDLTPGQKSDLNRHAMANQISHIEIFDFNILRHLLDQPEGLLARLKFLNISMTADEQAALLSKYGQQLQDAVTARFDRVERTLAKMERFLDLQTPIFRVDAYLEFTTKPAPEDILDEAALITLTGLQAFDKSVHLFLQVAPNQDKPNSIIVQPSSWICEHPEHLLRVPQSIIYNGPVMAAYYELSLYAAGTRHALGHATQLVVRARCSPKLQELVSRIIVDVNGYEVVNYPPAFNQPIEPVTWANDIPDQIRDRVSLPLLNTQFRNLLFQPFERSPRFQPLYRT